MNAPDRTNSPRPAPARTEALLGLTVIALAAIATVGGCASDEPVGTKKTTTKTTVETPTEKKTVTETHEKETTQNPR